MPKPGISFDELLNKMLERDPEFKKEWEASQPRLNLMKEVLKARQKSKVTQKQLSVLSGLDQGDISKIERGLSNPTLKTLQKIADALNMDVSIKFTPKN